MKKQSKTIKRKRKPKENPRKNKFVFQLDKYEKMEFERQFEMSEFSTKADFIRDALSKRAVKIVIHYKSVNDFYIRLTSFHSQFRVIAMGYNQVLSHLFKYFSERNAKLMLAKLEKQTMELIRMQQEIRKATSEFERKMEDTYTEKKIIKMDFLKSEK